MLIIISLLLGLYGVSYILSPKNKRNKERLSGYECGLETFSNAKVEIKITYYIIGILYLIFDLEIIFIYPLAVSLSLINFIGFLTIMFFFILLTLAFIYEWYQGVLDIEKDLK